MIAKKQTNFSRSHFFHYYYQVLPQTRINNYTQKLRSNSSTTAVHSSSPSFSFSTSPFPPSVISFKISINPSIPLPHFDSCLFSVNKKWFLNLSSSHIFFEVQCLLQLGEKFSLPNSNISHKYIFDFIKYIECGVKRLDPEVSHFIRNPAVHNASQ